MNRVIFQTRHDYECFEIRDLGFGEIEAISVQRYEGQSARLDRDDLWDLAQGILTYLREAEE